jgi:hypothetical protein
MSDISIQFTWFDLLLVALLIGWPGLLLGAALGAVAGGAIASTARSSARSSGSVSGSACNLPGDSIAASAITCVHPRSSVVSIPA